MWRKKGHLKVAEKNRKWRKKILELAGDQSQNMVTMVSMAQPSAPVGATSTSSFGQEPIHIDRDQPTTSGAQISLYSPQLEGYHQHQPLPTYSSTTASPAQSSL